MFDSFMNFMVTIGLGGLAVFMASVGILIVLGITAIPFSLAYLLFRTACAIH